MNIRRSTNYIDGERYRFDFGECSAAHGFAQLDTESDAWYYGAWANPHTLQLVTYTEGDITHQTTEDPADFIAAVRDFAAFGGPDHFKGIDPMGGAGIAEAFRALGLGDLLH